MESTTIEGIKVSPIGLGTSRLASLGARHSVRDAARLVDAAFDLGVTFIDTADTYGSTECERWLGEVTHRQPHRFAFASKCGLPTVDLPGPLGRFNQPAKKVRQRIGKDHYLDPGYVRRSIDASLRRLRRERIEFYFLHEPPLGVEHMDGLFDVLEDARTRGKIGTFGVASPDLHVIAAVTAVRKCKVAQTAVNPGTTNALATFLNSAPGADGLELVANHALSANLKHSRVQLLVRHAAALDQVRVVLVGTGNPDHLAECVDALAIPAGHEDLLT